MAAGKITKRAVDAIKLVTGRDTYLWDSSLTGFGVKVTPSGRRVYLVQYKVGLGRKGRTRRVTIGRHGAPWTAELARRKARELLHEAAAGKDPAEAKVQAKLRLKTVSELCELYLAEGCAAKKDTTVYTDRGRIRRHIIPLLGRRSIHEVSRSDVERFMHDVASGKTAVDERTGKYGRARVTGGKGVAAKCVLLLSAIYEFANSTNPPLVTGNPTAKVKVFAEQKLGRKPLKSDQLARLGDALGKAEADGVSPIAINAIRLLALTGCRRGEVLSLKWEFVDLDNKLLRLPDTKTGEPRDVPLGPPALELLASVWHEDGNPYVFPSAQQGHFKGVTKVWYKVRAAAGLSHLRLHDLRHNFAGTGVSGGQSLPIIGALLGHKRSITTERYATVADDPQQIAARKISTEIAAGMNGRGEDRGNVVDLKQTA